jgi:hypothetical protein
MAPPEFPQFDEHFTPPEILAVIRDFVSQYWVYLFSPTQPNAEMVTTKKAGLEFLFKMVEAPAFGIVVSLLLVPLVMSGAIPLTAWGSVTAAWFISILSIGRNQWVKRLTLGRRASLVLGCALVMGLVGDRYIHWSIVNYYRNQPKPQNNPDEFFQALRQIVHEELQKAKEEAASKKPVSVIPAPEPKPSLMELEIEDKVLEELQAKGLVIQRLPSQSAAAFSGLTKEDLRPLVNNSAQLMLGVSKFWAPQIEDADRGLEDMISKGGPPPGSGHGPMLTRLGFQRDIKPLLPKANDLRREMLSRVSDVTEEDAIQSKWFANALKEEGVDPPDPASVTKAAIYLLSLAARVMR